MGASWVHSAAAILANVEGLLAESVERRYHEWICDLEAQCSKARLYCALREAACHFFKVTDGYGPNLFHCYRIADVPRTNNALR